jgi:hypothetical protein
MTDNFESIGASGYSFPQASGPGGEASSPPGRLSSPARTAADDERIALHESGHVLVGRLLGREVGGVTCEPGPDFGGLMWGPAHNREAKFSSGNADTASIVAIIGASMPGPGVSRTDFADVYMHAHTTVIESVAGSVAEAMFLPGEPWPAKSDRAQERELASLICSSPDAVEALIAACRNEAAALLRPNKYLVRALTKELLVRRTMTGKEIDDVIRIAIAHQDLAAERVRRAKWKNLVENAAKFHFESIKEQRR